ncbi:MAG: hypothetical protein Q4B60_07780 [Erysipelotrichaceae bacterium]|nr:hypothetical protein [Erysipelotrichaceae bacterium]
MDKLQKTISKYLDAVMAILTVYRPLTVEEINGVMEDYFPELAKECDIEDLQDFLNMMVSDNGIKEFDDHYSVFDVEEIEESINALPMGPIGPKEFKDGKEILKKTDIFYYAGLAAGKKLIEYLNTVPVKKGVDKQRAIYSTVGLIFGCPMEEDVDFLLKKFFKKADTNLVFSYLNDLIGVVPRPFLNGHSFKELGKMTEEFVEERLEKINSLSKPITYYPKKANYKDFTYEECMELANRFDVTKLCKMVDSDRLLELTINGENVYASVLGFHGRDYGIVIYPDYDEMAEVYPFIFGDKGGDEAVKYYPDLAFRISAIEVCMSDPKGFANDRVLKEMEEKNYPLYPSFIRLKQNEETRLVNKKELNIVGGVLSDLLKMMQNTDFSDISLNLGLKKEGELTNINQVYVTDKETIFGEVFDPTLADIYLNIEPDYFDTKKLKKFKQLKNKKDIQVSLFVSPYCEDGDQPYMYIINDLNTGMILEMQLVSLKDMHNIDNILLDKFIELGFGVNQLYVNNEHTYEALIDFKDEVEAYWINNDTSFNDIYMEMLMGDMEEDDKMFS